MLVACQRLQEGAHYVSDVVFGAALGTPVAALCLYRGPITALFDRREALWAQGVRSIPQRALSPESRDSVAVLRPA